MQVEGLPAKLKTRCACKSYPRRRVLSSLAAACYLGTITASPCGRMSIQSFLCFQ